MTKSLGKVLCFTGEGGRQGGLGGGWCSTRGDTALSQAPLSSVMCLLVMGTGAQFSLGRCYCWACLLCQVLPSLPKKEVGTRPSDIKRKEDGKRALAAQPAPCKSSETCPLPDRSSRRTAEDGSGWKRTFPSWMSPCHVSAVRLNISEGAVLAS